MLLHGSIYRYMVDFVAMRNKIRKTRWLHFRLEQYWKSVPIISPLMQLLTFLILGLKKLKFDAFTEREC